MKVFTQWEVEEAVRYAEDGGQALHLHKIIVDYDKAPSCFVKAVRSGKDIAHLFDQNRERLEQTVRRLGVNIVVVEHAGQPGQHVDLCGGPLERAKRLCRKRRGGEKGLL